MNTQRQNMCYMYDRALYRSSATSSADLACILGPAASIINLSPSARTARKHTALYHHQCIQYIRQYSTKCSTRYTHCSCQSLYTAVNPSCRVYFWARQDPLCCSKMAQFSLWRMIISTDAILQKSTACEKNKIHNLSFL